MDDPLKGLTDAHLQAALESFIYSSATPSDVREKPGCYAILLAHARQIAENEKLAAERDAAKAKLAELRAKYEPEPVDPVKVEAEKMYEGWVNSTEPGWQMVERAIRRGISMPPAPFTRDEAVRIAKKLYWKRRNL